MQIKNENLKYRRNNKRGVYKQKNVINNFIKKCMYEKH